MLLLDRPYKPLARFGPSDFVSRLDYAALKRAARVQAVQSRIQASNLTGTWCELLFRNKGDFTLMSTTGAETSFVAGQNQQARIPAGFFGNLFPQRAIKILARGVLTTTTGTPTFTIQARLGATIGTAFITGTSIGVSPAIVSITGVTNQYWQLEIDLISTIAGQGAGNSTLAGAGYIRSPGGFAAPYEYALEPTTPPTATWTSVFDDSVDQYLNLTATLQATGAPSITCKTLLMFGLN